MCEKHPVTMMKWWALLLLDIKIIRAECSKTEAGKLASANGHLDIYSIIWRSHKIVNIKITLESQGACRCLGRGQSR